MTQRLDRSVLPRDLARRYGRQTRLAEIGEAGQAKLCAAKVSPTGEGFARTIESRYLAGAGLAVGDRAEGSALDPATGVELPELGLRHAAARDVADGALRALAAIRRTLESEAPSRDADAGSRA